jgi:hypothetical protein
MEFGIQCSPAQMRKLKTGGAITLKRENMMEDSPYRISVMPNTGRRIHTAMRKNTGVRINLKPEEDFYTMTQGGKVSFKSIGKSIKKGFTKGADVVKKGFNKEIVQSGIGDQIATSLIDAGIPAVLGVAGEAVGGPAGAVGAAVLGDMAAKQIEKSRGRGIKKGNRRVGQPAGARLAYDDLQGKGFFKSLSKVGIKKKDFIKGAKTAGIMLATAGAKAAGDSITAYTGNPKAGEMFSAVASAGATKAIESGSVKKGLKSAGSQAKDYAKDVALEAIDDYVDKNLSGAEKRVVEKALAGKYPAAKDLIYDYGNSKIEDMGFSKEMMAVPQAFSGYGIPRRTRGGMRCGSGSAYLTPSYAIGMKSAMRGAGVGFRVADDRVITPAVAPSDIIQTGSPFQRINSAAMSPFIAGSPQLAKPIPRMYGGSFLSAGARMNGGSFMPA